MGSTYGLASIILIIAIYWITTQVRKHLSSEKHESPSQICDTYLDMRRSIQEGNANVSVRSTGPARVLADTQEVAVGRLIIRTNSALYEIFPSETCSGPSKTTEGKQATEEDAFGNIIRNQQQNLKTTKDSVWYKTTQLETCSGPSRTTEGKQDAEEDAFGYMIHNQQPNLKTTAEGAWNRGLHVQAQVHRQHELNEEGYLVANVM